MFTVNYCSNIVSVSIYQVDTNTLENQTFRNIKHDLRGFTEAVVQRCSVKKVFLEISQNSPENTCVRASF